MQITSKTFLLCITGALLAFSLKTSYANDWRALKGTFIVGKAPLSDPLPDSALVTFVAIEGSAAREMFNGMVNAKIQRDACGEPGLTMKILNNLVCSKLRAEYTCNFGVGLSDGQLQLGYTC
jgi:hypothetical protein